MTEKLPFISHKVYKSGSSKYFFLESEVYKVLFDLGFRFVRSNREPFLYFQDPNSQVKLVNHLQELRDAFCDYIKRLPIPKTEIEEILNAFYAQIPIKRNGLIELYLRDTTEPSIYLVDELKRQKKNR